MVRQDHDRSATSAQRSLYAASGNSGAKHPPRFPPTVASSRRRHATPYRRMAARPNALGRGAIRGRQTATIWAVHSHRLSNACRIRPESAHRNGSHCKDAHEQSRIRARRKNLITCKDLVLRSAGSMLNGSINLSHELLFRSTFW